MWSKVTLPYGSKARSRAGPSAASRLRGASPAPAATASSLRRSRRETSIQLVPNAGHAERLAVVERGQIELELRVLDRVGREHVHAERGHAPLEALAHVPDLGPVRPPGRKVPRQPGPHVRQKPAAQELARRGVGRVAIGARVVALADLAMEGRLAARQSRSGLRTVEVDAHE